MHALIHLLASILVVPYLALAGLFLFIGEVARTKNVFALLDVALEHALWILGWGIYLLPLLWLILAASGAVPRFHKASSLGPRPSGFKQLGDYRHAGVVAD